MALQLNEQVVPYKEFDGKITEQMPKLIKEGRLPVSVSGLMQRRLQVDDAKYSSEVRSAWHDNYFDTGDAIVYHPDGKVKIVHDAKSLREISPNSKLSDGALVLPAGAYESLDGAQFTKEDLRKYMKDSLTRAEAKSNPLWNAMARDGNLLDAYVDFVFDTNQKRFSYDQNMGLYVGSSQKDETARSVFVDGLRDGSGADGRGHLGIDSGHLVGVAPEARVAAKAVPQALEQRV